MQTCVCRHVLFSISLYSLISKHALYVLCSPFPLLTYTHAHAIVMSVKLQFCLYACLVVFLCLVCLLAVCLFVLSCVTHDCACACIVCLLVCAVMCDSCLCLCLYCRSACICTSPHEVQTSNSNTTSMIAQLQNLYVGLCQKHKKTSQLSQLFIHSEWPSSHCLLVFS